MDNEGGIWCALGPEISEVMAKITGSEACNTLLAYIYDVLKYIKYTDLMASLGPWCRGEGLQVSSGLGRHQLLAGGTSDFDLE